MKYIIEFNKYDKDSRSENISVDVFKSILKSNCKNWLSNMRPLIRFKKSENSEFQLLNPKLHKRKSLNDYNYNTMLMDNLPSWSKFPKRSESVIFYNDINYNYLFGEFLYFIIPFDGAKFGTAPSDDLFTSYNKLPFNMSFDDKFSLDFFYIGAPNSYKEFHKYMNEEFKKEDFMENKHTSYKFEKFRNFILSKDGNTMNIMNDILSPNNFESEYLDEFKVCNYKEMIDRKNGKNPVECWTDSKCLLVSMGNSFAQNEAGVQDLYESFITELKKELKK